MGDQAVVVTGVLNRDRDNFETQYEIRRFRIGKQVFCAWCGPQKGDPPPGHHDLANGTLRCRFDPADYRTPVDNFISSDVLQLEGVHSKIFQFNHHGFHIGAKESQWDYKVGSLFHLVLPSTHLPFPKVESIEPHPSYGWRINDRFAIGWQGPLFRKYVFSFQKVSPELFEKQAEQLKWNIKSLSQVDINDPLANVQVDHEYSNESTPNTTARDYDLFISHASEDKKVVARPLFDALTANGVSVWFDEATLELGDSLRRKIDDGLARCRYGVVILSPRFFEKQWPQRELDGLVARETASGKKAIIPVWHELDSNTLIHYSSTLADRVAARSEEGIPVIVEKILRVLEM